MSPLNTFLFSLSGVAPLSDLFVILPSFSSSLSMFVFFLSVFFYLGLCLPLLAEGDYCPWDRELQSGLWLEKHLTDEEDVTGTFKGSCGACGCLCSYFGRDI